MIYFLIDWLKFIEKILSLYGSFQASEGEWKGVPCYSRETRTMGLLELGCWISLIKISKKLHLFFLQSKALVQLTRWFQRCSTSAAVMNLSKRAMSHMDVPGQWSTQWMQDNIRCNNSITTWSIYYFNSWKYILLFHQLTSFFRFHEIKGKVTLWSILLHGSKAKALNWSNRNTSTSVKGVNS